MVMLKSDIASAKAFIAIVFKKAKLTEDMLSDIKTRFRFAELLNKPRYLFIEKGSVPSGDVTKMDWSKIMKFRDECELSGLIAYCDMESSGGKYYT